MIPYGPREAPSNLPKWELVAEDTERLDVQSGWLYRSRHRFEISAPVFVPYAREWTGPK